MSGIESLDITDNFDKAIINKASLRLLDKQTGTFKDKDFSLNFSINKTEQFLKLNGSFGGPQKANCKSNNLKYIDKKASNKSLFDNSYLNCYFKLHAKANKQLD